MDGEVFGEGERSVLSYEGIVEEQEFVAILVFEADGTTGAVRRSEAEAGGGAGG